MDEQTTKVRAGVAFGMAALCVVIAIVVLSYTMGGSDNTAAVPQANATGEAEAL